MKITYLDPVWSRVDQASIPLLHPVLSYKCEIWIQGRFGRRAQSYQKYIVRKDGRFLTGYIPRVLDYFHKRKASIDYSPPEVSFRYKPSPLLGQLREEQLEAVETCTNKMRGVVHYPTGSGKTEIFLAIASMFSDCPSLIIAGGLDLLHQTVDRAIDYFGPSMVGQIGDGVFDPSQITIASPHTLKGFPKSRWHESIRILIVDEAHHVSRFGGMYDKILRNIPAPMRLGFTATLPYLEEAKWCLEGNIGPVIISKTLKEIADTGVLVMPRLSITKLPFDRKIKELRTYKEVYRRGVIENRKTNRIKLQRAIGRVKEGRSVLVLVKEIEHGQNLLGMCQRLWPDVKVVLLYGGSPGELRNRIRGALNERKVDVVIATVIWKQSIDIPHLGALVNAASGKSEIATIQSVGRTTRRPPGKEDVWIEDFFDPSHHYLINHFGERLTLYMDEKWDCIFDR
jgi:superfamily II DNA or RNA helicase